MNKPTANITFTSYNGIPVTLLAAPKGKWIADVSGKASIGPLAWSALVQNLEFNLSSRNVHRTLGA